MTGARTRVWAALTLAPVLLAAVAALAPARASESAFDLRRAPIDSTDAASLQRGAKLFVNYCLGCHGAALITYDRVAEDLRIDEEIMREHLRFGAAASAPLASAMDAVTARDWFYQAAPPDLSLIARARGADWLFGYLRHFYRDESRPGGWNNLLFPNVAMPHAMADLQGEARLVEGALQIETPGALAAVEYDRVAADLVNFLVYVGEPSQNERKRVGYLLMPLLFLFMTIAYFLYREYWRDLR